MTAMISWPLLPHGYAGAVVKRIRTSVSHSQRNRVSLVMTGYMQTGNEYVKWNVAGSSTTLRRVRVVLTGRQTVMHAAG